jgi:hypothetical protein
MAEAGQSPAVTSPGWYAEPSQPGMKARTRIRESFHMKDGDGLAIAGIALGWFQLAVLVIVIVVFVAAAASGS